MMWIAAACALSIAVLCAPDDPPTNPDLGAVLESEALERDLDEVRRVIDQEWILANSTGANYAEAIQAIKARGRTTTAEFALDLQRLLALSADGHATSGWKYSAMKHISGRELPFTLEIVGDRYVAIDPTSFRRNQLWNPDLPYVVAMDGVSTERWVAAAMPLIPRSHPLSMRAQACNLIRFAGYFRTLLEIEDSPTFTVDLESVEGKRVSLVVDDSGTSRESLFKYSQFLEGQEPWRITDSNLGYIKVIGYSDVMGPRLVEAMPKLRGTRGLVLDVRGGQGGVGETLNLLGIWLTGGEHPRHFAGIERKPKGAPVTGNFHTVDADSPDLSPEGRQLVASWLERFRGEWVPPSAIPMVDRCVLLAPPSAEPRIMPYSHPDVDRLLPPESIYYYDRPVAILVDRHSFSAEELIAAGLQGLPNVTVVGERTRGGGGASKTFLLPASGLTFQVAAKSIYIPPNGHSIDGAGVVPDIHVDVDLETITGPGDPMLDRAMREVEWALTQGQIQPASASVAPLP